MQNQIIKPKTIPQNIWEAAQLIASIIDRKRQKLENFPPSKSNYHGRVTKFLIGK